MNFKNIKGMEFDSSILVLGDLHGVWRKANFLITKHRPAVVLQVGDFGWWPQFHKTTHISTGVYRYDELYGVKQEAGFNQYGLKPGEAKVYFCPGNHENWEDLNLKATSDNPIHVELFKNVFYMPRCSVLKLPDGRNVLFIGGADSIDKEARKYRYDWYSEEIITQKDIYNLPDVKIDIVVSHTSPGLFKTDLFEGSDDWHQKDSYWLTKFKDPSCVALDAVWDKYQPKLWFFGHYHVARYGTYRDTRWFALNKETETGWWTFLPKG
jgi:hypothetical protein